MSEESKAALKESSLKRRDTESIKATRLKPLGADTPTLPLSLQQEAQRNPKLRRMSSQQMTKLGDIQEDSTEYAGPQEKPRRRSSIDRGGGRNSWESKEGERNSTQKEGRARGESWGGPRGGRRRKGSMDAQEAASASHSVVANSEHDSRITRPEKRHEGYSNLNKLVKKMPMQEL